MLQGILHNDYHREVIAMYVMTSNYKKTNNVKLCQGIEVFDLLKWEGIVEF